MQVYTSIFAGQRQVGRAAHRPIALKIALVLAFAAVLPASFHAFGRAGLPFGIDIVALAEDYNWLIILAGRGLSEKAQIFWSMNDRNPLSPWWYILAGPLYLGQHNGPYLTRLLMQPLLGLSAFFLVHCVTQGRASGLAFAAAIVIAVGIYGVSIDEITWNFLGALSLSML